MDGRRLAQSLDLAPYKDATTERSDAGLGRIAQPNRRKCAGLKHGSAYTRDELSAMSNGRK
jgi:hypothetical protein